MVLIESLEHSKHQELVDQIAALEEQLAALRSGQKEQGEELKAFRGEFNSALKRTLDRRA